MSRIFINYRRDDSVATAGRLHDHLAQAFGRKNLFLDVDHIPAGVDFVAHLDSKVSSCEVLLALIGRNWLGASHADGRRRLEDPNDFVALEIVSALNRGIPIIPVLIDGAAMPGEAELPDRLKPFSRRNAVEIRNTQFGSDADRLVAKIRRIVKPGLLTRLRWPLALLVLAALAVLGWQAYQHSSQWLPVATRDAAPPDDKATISSLVPKAETYCDPMKRVLAAADNRFESILGRTFGDNRIAQVPLPNWEDCIVFMENRFSDARRYACSLSGFPDVQSAEKAAETIAADLKAKCLGESWAIGRSFNTDGRRRTRLVSDASKSEISLQPSRLATAPSWSLNLDVQY